ncbi:cysteine--tRNA ligase [Candidatus Woesearchaeota archaeon]|nr:cysteine--tRNA ligase [Candidatus Woesearchaeota archaeon]
MALRLYNTLSRKKEIFKPLKDKKVGMYSCGPTVYHYTHIGNLRTFVFNDILRRTLKYLGFELKHVMNITDVGHLTSDADEGEDKMLLGAKREKKTVWDIAKYYTDAFMKDIELLNIETPEIIPKATDHIKEMIDIIKLIEKNGYAYVAGGNVYFDSSKFKSYIDLAKLNLEELEKHSRVEKDKNKKNHSDFVLWFTKSKFEDQEMKWDSPWGTGYPGWHIECSAMSSKYLGEQFDIHTGGIDLIPVHHTNEIAQSETAYGKSPWVKYWLHGEFIILGKDKMSKSKGDFLRLQSLIDKGYKPIVYRYFCLTANYRQQLHFSYEALDAARNAYEGLRSRVLELRKDDKKKDSDVEAKTKHETEFIDAVQDDINMPRALAVVFAVLKDDAISNKDKLGLLYDFDKVLGLGFEDFKEDKVVVSKEVKVLIEKREKARKLKDWASADKIRDEIKKLGYNIKDTQQGVKVEKI